MSELGKQVRLNRIFSHPSGRMLGIAVDHMINYPIGMPRGLRDIEVTVRKIVEGRPSSITLNKGVAMRCFKELAGRAPFIVQQMAIPLRAGFDYADHTTPEEVVAMGGDAIAVSFFVKCPRELEYIKHLGQVVREAERFGLPVVPHIYPLEEGDPLAVSRKAEDLYYAARVGFELGADLLKIPYTGDKASFADIVNSIPVRIVTAGGPKCETIEEAEAMMRDVAASGAAGATVGRNVWGFSDIPEAVARLKGALFGRMDNR